MNRQIANLTIRHLLHQFLKHYFFNVICKIMLVCLLYNGKMIKLMIEQTKLPDKINYLFNNIQKNKKLMNSVSEVKNTLKYSLHS